MECTEIFAKRIKELREAKGLSIRELASILGLGHTTINQYEKCQRTPDIFTAKKFANYFGVTLDYLTSLDEDDRR